jgi:putative phage-type endonuclease
VIQGDMEWRLARCGSLGASQVSLALAKTKTGYGASRANIRAQLIAERLTGVPCETYQNEAMRYGSETEPEARAAYEFYHSVTVTQIAIVRHPRLSYAHASPDGLIAEDGLVEFKCPNVATHLETLMSEQFDGKYHIQAQWQMAVTGRKWCDLASYCNQMPPEMRLYVQRIARDEKLIAELEKEVELFLREVATLHMALISKYPEAA